MPHYLSHLKPGTRFRLAEMPEVTGTLVKASDSRAVVRLDRPEREIEFIDHAGETRQFKSRAAHVTSWASTTLVEVIGFQTPSDEEDDMSKSTTKKAGKSKTAKAAKANGKLSCLDAAAKVLSESKEPLTTKQMIEAMANKKYWTSPGGQTPSATLYSAILREIQTKGKEARFKKADRGLFSLTGK